ncbi:MAG: hypothetical protein IJ728_10940 [Selenomonadaceae bacterium]|nr:hypothetical protein [Selenomonadaceae bacterium]
MHVFYAYGGAPTYAKYVGTSICSILENTSASVMFHIFHDDSLTNDNRKKFIQLISRYGQYISFYNVQEQMNEIERRLSSHNKESQKNRFGGITLSRVLIGDVLPKYIKKLVFLDGDLIFNLDIVELWNEEIGENGFTAAVEWDMSVAVPDWRKFLLNGHPMVLAARENCPPEKYFNAGVMLVDLDKYREINDVITKLTDFLKNFPKCFAMDQDFFNYYYALGNRPLPVKYNSFMPWYSKDWINDMNRIVHYGNRTLRLNLNDPLQKVFYKYFVKTPWCTEEFLKKIFLEFIQSKAFMTYEMRRYCNLLSKKKRIFFDHVNFSEIIKNVFEINENDEIYFYKDEDELKKMFLKVVESIKQNKVCFAMSNFEILSKSLKDLNFIEDVDFVNVYKFLLPSEGARLIDDYKWFTSL